MTYTTFTSCDFEALTVPGLDARMDAIITHIRPKLEDLGKEFCPYLSALVGEEMHYHVAKHARRTVNPPNDTWVAFGTSKRGYKALPHFEVGLFASHLFIIFAIIYESPNKSVFANHMLRHTNSVMTNVPDQFYWSTDHMSPEGTLHKDLSTDSFQEMAHRLKTVKKAEIICGMRIDRNDPVLSDGTKLSTLIEQTFSTLVPLYKASF